MRAPFRNNEFLFILLFFFFNYSFSQIKEEKKDSTVAIYEKIEDYSEKTKATKLLHWLIFKSDEKSKNKTDVSEKQDYSSFEGKIIRHIKIESHDPFGFSFTDSTENANSWIEKTGNKLHIRSKDFAIKNLLIFKEDKPLDSLLINESKRLIRSQSFIRSVEINVKHIEKSPDSVDVYITTLDFWSLMPEVSLSKSKMKLQLNEKNYLGYGHGFKIGVKNRFSDGKLVSNLLYTIPNIKNTYIGTSIGHENDLDGFYNKHFSATRPFYSPYTKWAAGIYVDEQYKEVLPNSSTEFIDQNLKYQSQDVWAGYSIQLFKGQSERERTANIISAFRVLHKDYLEKPSIEYDSINYFSKETFYFGSIGISSRQFLEDRYIFRDGIIETVPIGDIYSITIGNQYKNQQSRLYLGAKVAHGDYYAWGYLSATFEYGTFLNKSKPEQTAFSFSANYFTNLISLGTRWKMRQFIKPQILIGKNRLSSPADRLTIDETDKFEDFYHDEERLKNIIGIPGFKSGLLGTTKYVLSLRTQFYPPWEIIGFRFNPYLDINAGMLGDENTQLNNTKLYSSFGVGLIIRNDYLVFNSIQLSLSYYPDIPGQGNNIFKTNALNSKDFGLQGFELEKPATIWYH